MGNTGSGLASRSVHEAVQKRATALYVSPSGSDSAAGTLAAPFLTIQKAVNTAVAGDTIYLRAGTYALTTNIQITKAGTASAPYTLTNYQSEKVIIDGEALPYTPAELNGSIPEASRGTIHISSGGAYWRFIGLEIIHGPYGVYSRDASNNYFERLITRDNYETGMQIQGAASNNIVVNLDSYGNRDPRKNGESADGIGIKEGSGTGNVIRGSRFWNNVDDGLDFWEFLSPVTVENCYSWGNGFNRWGFSDFAGDGNGFKLGGGAKDTKVAHSVKNSIAWNNAAGGFVDNTQPGNMVITRNTAWNNIGGTGLDFQDSTPTITGNIAVLNKVNYLLSTATSSGNSWQSGTWSNSSFKSVDSSTLTGARSSTGAIIASNFLLPSSGAAIGASYA
ncbi:putative pectate lyase [Ceratobasidium sp. AG-I]|nr:putative pectate lyase [Ceratobasidium sp. AG-I]